MTGRKGPYRIGGLNLFGTIIIEWNTAQVGRGVQKRLRAGFETFAVPDLTRLVRSW